MKIISIPFCAVALILFAHLVGCGGNDSGLNLVPVSGTITLDGAPLTGADVEFISQNVKVNEDGLGGSSGFTNTDGSGHFEMYTASYAGIQPGEYRVRINKVSKPEIVNPEARVPEGKELVPPRYNTKTDLVVEISKDGNTDLNFELKSQ